MKEVDLFAPIKEYWFGKGYKVNAEVKGFDITLTKENELIIIETKLIFNTKLLYQAISAQKVANFVYIALPTQNYKNLKNIVHICTCLGLGLITISHQGFVNVVLNNEIASLDKRLKNYKKLNIVTSEIKSRNFDTNIGGSNKTKLMTFYREKSIHIATCLSVLPYASASVLVNEYGCPKDTGNIIYANKYNWFTRISKAKYALSDEGKSAINLSQYKEIVDYYHDKSMKKFM